MISSLGNYFDAIYVINLDRRTDRWVQAQAELELCGIDTAERWPAYDCPSCGVYGCLKSHRSLIKKIAEGPGRNALILEDDFQLLTIELLIKAGFTPDSEVMKLFLSAPFPPQYARMADIDYDASERFKALISELPADWDVLYLGGGYQKPPLSRVSAHVIRNAGMLCTHAYAISKHHAREFSEALDKNIPQQDPVDGKIVDGIGAIDSILATWAPHHLYYTISPRLFIQRPQSRSDVNLGDGEGFPYSLTDAAHEAMV